MSGLREVERDDSLPTSGPVSQALCRVVSPTPGCWFDQGDVAVLRVIFSDPTDTTAPVDVNGFSIVTPSSVLCKILLPDGTEQTPTPAAVNSGFQVVFTVAEAGVFQWRIYSSPGTFQGVGAGFFQGRKQRS